ncbi:glycoside hydrolase family 5 protein [Hasllibacter sp. MH4015]|uniref:glycoside hydrolase family 5 protein n=1 Tax=Hasllibacter sp. MH4015 TaxID=2854029 RepID=UPI001CD6DF81|nr:glycoside hydrolase family 5 protein [Hasllibacter sp. MH4015]
MVCRFLLPLLFLTAPAAAFPVERCINLGAAMEAPVEGDWGYVIEAQHIAAIAQAGFDTIRLPVRFSAHWNGTYLSPDFLARVDQVLNWAFAADLHVILDLHHFNEMAFDPAFHGPRLIAIWSALARHYSDAPDALMFELFNEPHGAFTTERARPLFRQITAMIRRTHPDRWIITGGGDWNDLDEMLRLPDPRRAEVRTFHYYRPWSFTHQQAAYLPDPPPPSDWGSTADIAVLRSDMARAGAATGPVFLGEFGVYAATDQAARLAWIRAVREAAEANGIPWCYWGFTQGDVIGFSAFDTSTGQWEPGMLDALFD